MDTARLKQWLNEHFIESGRNRYLLPLAKSYTIDENNRIEISALDYKKIIFYAGLIPVVLILFDIVFDNLGSNPQQALHIRLGDWSLRFLCLTLFITPLQKITKWRGMAQYRQLLGLYAFFYASLHVIGYVLMDHALVWDVIYIDITESDYIWFGVFAYIIVFLLAITSPDLAKKILGKSWKKLHRWIYPASIAALIHYFWQLKGNLLEPMFYAAVIFILLFFRVLTWFKERQLRRLMIPKGRTLIE